jgi:REP element-mobilizing transposase RayT
MTEDACRLTSEMRAAVEQQLEETCGIRSWHLFAKNCRSNHVHIVVAAPNTDPKRVRTTLKAWATLCLRDGFDRSRENWWTERGSIRRIFDEASLEAAIIYVKDGQDLRHR